MHLKIQGNKSSKFVNLRSEFFEPSVTYRRGKKELLTARSKAHDLALDTMGASLISYQLYKGKELITEYTDKRSIEAKISGQSSAPKG